MEEHDATEISFKNGYKKGVEDLAYKLKDIPRFSVYKWEIDRIVEELRK